MNRRFVALVACLALGSALTGTSGVAAAATKKSKVKDATWRGRVEAAGDHYVYVGRACPEKTTMCVAMEARYEIRPTTGQARKALAGAVGNDTRLKGHLAKSNDPQYAKSLLVKKVTALEPAPPSGVAGTVTLEGACPDEDCDAVPLAADDLRLFRADGSVAATGQSARDGTFSIPAPPGSYTLRAGGDTGGMVECAPVHVKITTGRFTRANVRCEVNLPDMTDPGMPQVPGADPASTGNDVDFFQPR